MNLQINASNHPKVLDYHIELLSESVAFDTAIVLRGSFGWVKLHQVELPHCHVWIASHELAESIHIRGTGDKPVLQLRFPLPPNLELSLWSAQESSQASPSLALYFSYLQEPCFQLGSHFRTSLIMHFGEGFFSPGQAQMLSFIQQAAEGNGRQPAEQPIRLSAPFLLVLQQIIAFPLEDVHLSRYLKAKTEELLVHFLKTIESIYHTYQSLSPAELEKIQQVKHIIQSAPDRNFSDFELARAVSINVHTLKKKFKAFTGMTLSRFILQARMEAAEQRLTDSDTPIKTIAIELGYKNLSNFSETFKKFFGYPPNAVRKKN